MSLQKERIGTTLTVVWEVLTSGDAVSLEGRDIRVFAIDPHKKRTEMTDLQIGGSAMDVVTCVFEGKEQEHPGIYQLECIENYNKPNQAVLDDDVIMLVPRSKQRTGGSIGLATPTIQLTTGTLWVGVKGKDGKSAYELAVANGYEGTVTEWLASLHGRDADIAAATAATNAANAAAAAANDAAEDAEDATTAANTAASAANTAASSANAGEVVRQQNETQRNTNETNRQNSESQRQQTFQTNEAARQTAYQNAEANRNGAYQEAEEDRDGIFNSKEATRDAANQAALNCADELAALGPKTSKIETAEGSSETEVEFDTDNDEYVAHIDNDGIHAKELYLQNSRNGSARPLSTLENIVQNISDAASNISKEEEETFDECIVIGKSEDNPTIKFFDKKVVAYGDLFVCDQQTNETSRIDTDKRINAAIIRDYVASLDLSNYPIIGNVGILGDSTIAGYGGTKVRSLLTIDGIVTDISTSGDTIPGQTTKWNNIDSSVKAAMNYVFVQIGLNDSSDSRVDTTTFSQYQALVSSIRADAPSAKIILGTMVPCRERYYVTSNYIKSVAEVKYHNWKELNRAIIDMVFIGANACASFHTVAMGDPNDNLLSEFESTYNDHIHPNAAGTKMIAWSWLTKLYNN